MCGCVKSDFHKVRHKQQQEFLKNNGGMSNLYSYKKQG